MMAYAVKGHRHLPEISQGLRRAARGDIGLTFVPHLTPMIRGIHATLYATVADTSVDLQRLYEQRYADEPLWTSCPRAATLRPVACVAPTSAVSLCTALRVAIWS